MGFETAWTHPKGYVHHLKKPELVKAFNAGRRAGEEQKRKDAEWDAAQP